MSKLDTNTKEIPATSVPSTAFSVRIRVADSETAQTYGTITPKFDPSNDLLAQKPLRRPNRLRPLSENGK